MFYFAFDENEPKLDYSEDEYNTPLKAAYYPTKIKRVQKKKKKKKRRDMRYILCEFRGICFMNSQLSEV